MHHKCNYQLVVKSKVDSASHHSLWSKVIPIVLISMEEIYNINFLNMPLDIPLVRIF